MMFSKLILNHHTEYFNENCLTGKKRYSNKQFFLDQMKNVVEYVLFHHPEKLA